MVENHHAAVILTDTATARRSVFFFVGIIFASHVQQKKLLTFN